MLGPVSVIMRSLTGRQALLEQGVEHPHRRRRAHREPGVERRFPLAWTAALNLMEGMTSDRTLKAIQSIRPTLAVCQRRKVPGAAELALRAREALA